MLQQVGHPTVIGADPVLTAHAERRGWGRFAAIPGPLRAALAAE
jgi:phosphoserine phosphatase